MTIAISTLAIASALLAVVRPTLLSCAAAAILNAVAVFSLLA